MAKFIVARTLSASGIALAAVFFTFSGLEGSAAATPDTLKLEPPPDAPTVKLGTNFDVGGLAISGMQVGLAFNLGDFDDIPEMADGVFIVVTADVTNKDDKTHRLDSLDQTLYVGSKEYNADPFAGIVSNSRVKSSVSVPPGFSKKVMFAFDVPESTLTKWTGGPPAKLPLAEQTVLSVSGGLGAPEPQTINVVLNGGATNPSNTWQ